MLAIALFASATQGPDLEQKVSFRSVAIPVHRALAEITKTTRVRLESTGKVGAWPIIVSVKEVKLKDLMDRIAEVTDSEWTITKTECKLEHSLGKQAQSAQKEINELTARIQASRDRYPFSKTEAREWTAKEIAAYAEEDRKQKQQAYNSYKDGGAIGPQTAFVYSAGMPAKIILNEFLRKVPSKTLSMIPEGSRTVFSTSPTPRQQALPFSLSGSIDAYLRTRQRFANALDRRFINPTGISVYSGADLASEGMPLPLKVLVSVDRTNSYRVSIAVVDADGMLRDWCEDTAHSQPGSSGHSPVPASLAGKINLQPLSKELILALPFNDRAGMRYIYGSQEPLMVPLKLAGTLSSALVKALRSPVQVDPQSFFVSDTLLSIADALDRNLVALCPDSAFTNLVAGFRRNLDLKQAWARLSPTMELTDTAPWLLGSPRGRGQMSGTIFSRVALERLFSQSGPSRFVTFAEGARYALTKPLRASSARLDSTWANLVDPNVGVWTMLDDPYRALLGAYMAFPVADRNAMKTRAFPWDALPLEAQKELVALASMTNYRVNYTVNSTARRVPVATVEPTETPWSAPSISLTIARDTKRTLAAYKEDGSIIFMSPFQLGLREGILPGNVEGVVLDRVFGKFKFADQDTIEISLRGTLSSSAGFNDYRLGGGVVISQLPQAMLDRIAEGRKAGQTIVYRPNSGSGRQVRPPQP